MGVRRLGGRAGPPRREAHSGRLAVAGRPAAALWRPPAPGTSPHIHGSVVTMVSAPSGALSQPRKCLPACSRALPTNLPMFKISAHWNEKYHAVNIFHQYKWLTTLESSFFLTIYIRTTTWLASS